MCLSTWTVFHVEHVAPRQGDRIDSFRCSSCHDRSISAVSRGTRINLAITIKSKARAILGSHVLIAMKYRTEAAPHTIYGTEHLALWFYKVSSALFAVLA